MKTGFILDGLKDDQTCLFQVLESSHPGINITVATTIEGAEKKLMTLKPDIALIDIHLSDGAGVSILELISKKYPCCISVVITIYDDDDSLFSALRAGAQGYLLKQQKKDELVKALQGINAGKPALSPQISNIILDYFSSKSALPVVNKGVVSVAQLSKREQEVLKIIAQGLSSKQVASELNISYHTVVRHIKNIYSKLNISSRAEVAQEAARLGLLDK